MKILYGVIILLLCLVVAKPFLQEEPVRDVRALILQEQTDDKVVELDKKVDVLIQMMERKLIIDNIINERLKNSGLLINSKRYKEIVGDL